MPLHLLWTHSLHCKHSMQFLLPPLQQTTQGYPTDFFKVIKTNNRDKELGILHADMKPFIFHANLSRLELGDTLLFGVCDKQQVISIERLPNAHQQITWQHFWHQDREQWAEDRGLMHTSPTPNSSMYCTWLQALDYMVCMTRTAHS